MRNVCEREDGWENVVEETIGGPDADWSGRAEGDIAAAAGSVILRRRSFAQIRPRLYTTLNWRFSSSKILSRKSVESTESM